MTRAARRAGLGACWRGRLAGGGWPGRWWRWLGRGWWDAGQGRASSGRLMAAIFQEGRGGGWRARLAVRGCGATGRLIEAVAETCDRYSLAVRRLDEAEPAGRIMACNWIRRAVALQTTPMVGRLVDK